MARVLGLDLGASCGWSIVETNGDQHKLLAHGILRFDRGPKGGQRKARVVDGVKALIEAWEPTVVCYERVDFMKFRMAYAAHCEYRSLVEYAAYTHGLETVGVAVTTLKKWATGRGKASKADMCGAVSRMFDLSLTARKPGKKRGKAVGTKADEDVADAILVGAWCADRKNKVVV